MSRLNIQPNPDGAIVAQYTYISPKYRCRGVFRLVVLVGRNDGVLRCILPGWSERVCTHRGLEVISSLDTFKADIRKWWKGYFTEVYRYGLRY